MYLDRVRGFSLFIFLIAAPLAMCQANIALRDTKELRDQNSKLFHHSGSTSTIYDYVDLPGVKASNSATRDVTLYDTPSYHDWEENPSEKSREAYLLSSAASSDLVVIAQPLERHSDPTEDRRFVFSNYTVAVDRVLRAKGLTVLPGQDIVVTRLGGSLQYHGRNIVGTVVGFDVFQINEPYVMFLRLLPNGTFLVIGNAAYNIRDAQVETHHNQHASKNEIKKVVPKDEFIEDVDRAIRRLESVSR